MINNIKAGNVIKKGSTVKLIDVSMRELRKLVRFLSDRSSLKYSLQRVLMAINIDGSSISSITIDGNQVQEVTIDGNVVWTASTTTTNTETWENGTVAWDNFGSFSSWTGDTGRLSTTTNSLSGTYSLEVDQSSDMTASANFTKYPTEINYTLQHNITSTSTLGDSAQERFEDGNGNRISQVKMTHQADGYQNNTTFFDANGEHVISSNRSDGSIWNINYVLDWGAETFDLTVDGPNGTSSFTDRPFSQSTSTGEFKIEFYADADGWSFLRRYDDWKMTMN